MKRLALLLSALMLAGCTTPSLEAVKRDIAANSAARYQEAMSAKAQADKESSPARGQKTCHIRQLTSAYLTKEIKEGREWSAVTSVSTVFARVYKNGSVGLAVSDDVYPGTNAYFLIDGKRYSGKGDSYVPIDAAGLAALKSDHLIDFSWTNWPYRSEINRKDVLAGFADAYAECVDFLR